MCSIMVDALVHEACGETVYANLRSIAVGTLPDEKKFVTLGETSARLGEVKESDAYQVTSATAQRTVDCLQEVIERMMMAAHPSQQKKKAPTSSKKNQSQPGGREGSDQLSGGERGFTTVGGPNLVVVVVLCFRSGSSACV